MLGKGGASEGGSFNSAPKATSTQVSQEPDFDDDIPF